MKKIVEIALVIAVMVLVILLMISALLSMTVDAANWKVRTYATVPADDPYLVAGGPTNWGAEWVDIGTNVSASAPYTFVGDDLSRSNWVAARIAAWRTWRTNVYEVQQASIESNRVFVLNQNLATLNNLYQTNVVFMGLVATNRPAVTVTVLSNQTVTVTRILNQIGPLLRDLYNERQIKGLDQ